MPTVRPFRALRYDPATVGDLAPVTAPPYDVIDIGGPGSSGGPSSGQRRAAGPARGRAGRRAGRSLSPGGPDACRAGAPTGRCARIRIPPLYVYEQTYRVPGTTTERTQRGFFARLRLEALDEGGVLPHERTLTGPKEDRYKLLRATGVNTSPVIVLFDDPAGGTAPRLDEVASRPAGGRGRRRRRRASSTVGRARRRRGAVRRPGGRARRRGGRRTRDHR